MNRYDLKRPIGWVFLVLSVFGIFGTLRAKYGGGPPFPQFVPFFGIPFVILFLAAQTGLCAWFRTKLGLALIAGVFLLGVLGGSIGESVWANKRHSPTNPAADRLLKENGVSSMEDYDWTRHKLIAGVCLSGIVIGGGFVGEKL